MNQNRAMIPRAIDGNPIGLNSGLGTAACLCVEQ